MKCNDKCNQEKSKLLESIKLLRGEKRGTFEARHEYILEWMSEILEGYDSGSRLSGKATETQFRELFERILDERNKTEKWAAAVAVDHYHLKKKVKSLFTAIEHGDEEHRRWLKEAIEKHFGE